MAAGVPLAGEEQVFIPGERDAAFLEVGRGAGVVAGDDVDRLAVGREAQGVRAVLAGALEVLELFDRVVVVVAVGVAGAVEAAAGAAVDGEVEGVERTEHALGAGDGEVEALDAGGLVSADGGRGDAGEALAFLVGGEEAALGVEGDGDPGAEFLARDGQEALDLEAGGDLEELARGAGQQGGAGEDVAPGIDAHGAEDLDRESAAAVAGGPAGVGDDVGDGAVFLDQGDFHGEAGGAAVVGDGDGQLVIALGAEAVGDLDLDGVGPFVALGDGAAVQADDEVVVSGGFEPGAFGGAGEVAVEGVVFPGAGPQIQLGTGPVSRTLESLGSGAGGSVPAAREGARSGFWL